MFRKLTLGLALLASATSIQAAANRPNGFTTICKSGQTCMVASPTQVAFGAAGKFVKKTLSGAFSCDVATFGSDPNPAKSVKECSVPDNAAIPGNGGGDGAVTVTLQADAGDGEVELSWSATGALRNVQVMRDTDANPIGRQRIARLAGDARTFRDAKANNGTSYWYWIKYTDAKGVVASSTAQFAQPLRDSSSADECFAGAVIKNKSVDCGGRTIGLSCNKDSEHQPPVLTLINASVKNLRISANGGSDGIHCTSGDCTLENVVWEDVCEDAATHSSEGGTMTIIGGWAYNSNNGPGGKPDKIFQHNSRHSTTIIKGGFTVKGDNGKLWRSCGDCKNNGGPRHLVVEDVFIEGTLSSGLAGVNSNYNDTATIRNLKVKNYKAGKPKICVEYEGVKKGEGKSEKKGEFWNTASCQVDQSDVFSY
ncbi:probable pectate lyase [Hahella chejuensis KCTC 2396]|uniref:pectate lyase n=1 Tax=Hahella chejuensis (strain KCTC 2396) TaxID=349521 RepID=Q2SNQ0_HAHCH|nr:pectate lyase [Hahella chejuensis]ABC27724.1 probable pectate lyase [Hahella chejuensis KCTC 2396]